MAFCPKCGKQLAEGETCTCSLNIAPDMAPAAPVTPAAPAAPEAAPAPAFEAAPAVPEAAEAPAYDPSLTAGYDYASAGQPAQASVVDKAVDFVKKNVKLVGGIAAGLVVIIIVICILAGGGSGSYKAPIEDVLNTVNNVKKTGYLGVLTAGQPKSYSDIYSSIMKLADEDDLEDMNDMFADYLEDLEDEYGKWKLTFEYGDVEKLDKDDLKDYQEEFEDIFEDYLEDTLEELEDADDDDIEDLADMLDCSEKEAEKLVKQMTSFMKKYEKIKVSQGYKVKGRYVLMDGKEEINKTDKATLYIINLNGDWVIAEAKDSSHPFSFDSSKKHSELYYFMESYLNNFYMRTLKNGISF